MKRFKLVKFLIGPVSKIVDTWSVFSYVRKELNSGVIDRFPSIGLLWRRVRFIEVAEIIVIGGIG